MRNSLNPYSEIELLPLESRDDLFIWNVLDEAAEAQRTWRQRTGEDSNATLD